MAEDPHERAADDPRRMTVAEWVALPEDEPGELVDGRLVEEEMPDLVHEIVVSWLVRTFGLWLADRGGFVFASEAKLVVGARRGRKPDVSMYLPGGAVPPGRGMVRTPPDVVVEVLERGGDGRYARAVAAADGTLDVPGCPGLALDLGALWAEVDRLGPPLPDDAEA